MECNGDHGTTKLCSVADKKVERDICEYEAYKFQDTKQWTREKTISLQYISTKSQ